MTNAWHIWQAVRFLHAGGILAYPTEAVYGLGCLLYAEEGVRRIVSLKRRSWQKGLIVVAADYGQIRRLIQCDDLIQKRLLASWPGPYTWLVRANPKVPRLVRGMSSEVAIRVSAHPIVRDLCLAVGPIISTSANPAGYPPARTSQKVRHYFRAGLDYIIPGEIEPTAKPTEIRQAQTGTLIRSASG